MPDPPIACSLSAEQARDRSVLIATVRADAMLEQEPIAGALRTRLRDDPSVEQRVKELIAAEQVCCSFLTFDVRATPARSCSTSPAPKTPSRSSQPSSPNDGQDVARPMLLAGGKALLR